MQWNDNMDEAPRDGTALLGYCPTADCKTTGFIFVVCYDPDLEEWVVDFPESQSWDEVTPVAWMPLPEPPK